MLSNVCETSPALASPVCVVSELVALVLELEDQAVVGEDDGDDSLTRALVVEGQQTLLAPGGPDHPHGHEDGELVREELAAGQQAVGTQVDVAGVARKGEGVHVAVAVVHQAHAGRKLVHPRNRFLQQVHWGQG